MFIPGGVVADLVVIEAGFVLGGLKALFDGPATGCDVDESF